VRPTLEVLEDRTVPTNITYHGGPTIPHVQVNNIVMGPQPVDTGALMQALVQDYLPLLGPYYGIGAGTLRSSITVSPLAGVPSDLQIQTLLVQEIKSGALPPPDSSQLYVIFLAPNQIVSDYAGTPTTGYHGSIPGYLLNGNPFSAPIYYAVNFGGTSQPVELSASHELAEAVTDPDGFTGYLDRGLSGGSAGEVADIYDTLLGFPLDGFQVSILSGPQGQKVGVIPPATLQNLINLAVQVVESMALQTLAPIDPSLTPYAQFADKILNSDLLYGTPQGQIGVLLGQAMFSNWLSQLNGG
jgi:hypothetical protein